MPTCTDFRCPGHDILHLTAILEIIAWIFALKCPRPSFFAAFGTVFSKKRAKAAIFDSTWARNANF